MAVAADVAALLIIMLLLLFISLSLSLGTFLSLMSQSVYESDIYEWIILTVCLSRSLYLQFLLSIQ